MNDLNWVLDLSFLELRFFDLPNLLICLLFVFVVGRKYKVSSLIQFILMMHCLVPFFSYGLLFSYGYMPDIFKYWTVVNAIRSGDITASTIDDLASTVYFSSFIFSFIPLPLVVTPLSLGLFSSFIYCFLFFWLFNRKVFTPLSIWFYLLYPSFALYAGLGLRDNIILFLMIVITQYAREKKWMRMLLISLPLYLIKFQNFFIVVPVMILYGALNIMTKGMSIGKAVFVFMIGSLSFIFLSPIVLPFINYYRAAMYLEDGGSIEDVKVISSTADFIFEGATSGFYFLLKPFVWEVDGILQFIQSIENILICLFLLLLVRAAWILERNKVIFWVLFIIFAFSIYGLVVFNFGTATRYRYPFIVMFVIFVCADCNVKSLVSNKNNYKAIVDVED